MSLTHPPGMQFHGASFTDVAGDLIVIQAGRGAVGDLLSGALKGLVATGAAYDAEERRPAPRCHPGTRLETLQEIEDWFHDDTTSVCWLHGPAGAGKSAVAQTISETFAERGLLASSFFFSRSAAGDRSTMKFLFPTLVDQIARSSADMLSNVENILRNDLRIAYRDGGPVQLFMRMVEPAAENPSSPRSYRLIVIDGLDECKGNDDQGLILKHIHTLINAKHFPLRFLVVSRPGPHIEDMFKATGIMAESSSRVSLYGENGSLHDIFSFLKSEFSRIHCSDKHRDTMRYVPKPWPSDEIIWSIANKSGGYYILPSTVMKYIDEEYFSPVARLDQVLGTTGSDSQPFAELDKLYMHVLSSCRDRPLLQRILGFPLSRNSTHLYMIEDMLRLQPGQGALTLRGLHSLLFVSHSRPVEFFHASFGDFLADKHRSQDFHVDRLRWERDILRNVLSSMGTLSQRDDLRLLDSITMDRVIYLWHKSQLDQNPQLEIVRDSLMHDPWKDCILALARWEGPRPFILIRFLFFLSKGLADHDADILRELSKLCDLFFSTHLALLGVMDSPHTIQNFQDLWTSIEFEYEFSKRSEPNQVQDLLLTEFTIPMALKIWKFFKSAYVPRGLDMEAHMWYIFEAFMNNPERCGPLYCAPEVRHARLAAICMNGLFTARSWVYHLLCVAPGDQRLLGHLHRLEDSRPPIDFDLDLYEADMVVDWLKSAKDPQNDDIVCVWEGRAREIKMREQKIIEVGYSL